LAKTRRAKRKKTDAAISKKHWRKDDEQNGKNKSHLEQNIGKIGVSHLLKQLALEQRDNGGRINLRFFANRWRNNCAAVHSARSRKARGGGGGAVDFRQRFSEIDNCQKRAPQLQTLRRREGRMTARRERGAERGRKQIQIATFRQRFSEKHYWQHQRRAQPHRQTRVRQRTGEMRPERSSNIPQTFFGNCV
jgi:hypothetical protein